jgi:hypothetical protein
VLAVLGTHAVSQLAKATWVAESLDGLAATVLPDGLKLRFSPARE